MKDNWCRVGLHLPVEVPDDRRDSVNPMIECVRCHKVKSTRDSGPHLLGLRRRLVREREA